MMQLKFSYHGKSYVATVGPMTEEDYEKYVISSSGMAEYLFKLEDFIEKCTELEKLDKLMAKKTELEASLSAGAPALAKSMTEAVSIDGKRVELGTLSVGELTCIGTLATKACLPTEEELKNLGS